MYYTLTSIIYERHRLRKPSRAWSFTIFHFRSAAPAVHCGRGASIPASGIILAQFNRAPIPFLQIVMRNQASGRGSSCSISSLKFALSRREQAAVFSHSPRHDVWLQTERLSRLQTFVPHSQDSRLPSPENASCERMRKRLRAGRGNQAGVRALRKPGDESRGQEEGRQTADAAGMGRAVVPRRRIARGRAKRRGVLRVRKPGAASVGEICARNQRFCRGRAG